MSDEHAESLREYWKWIHGLSPDVQKAVLACWDETGRPTTEKYEPVIMLMDTCDTWDEFLPKYSELMSCFAIDEWKVIDEAAMYWKVYLAGLYRV